MSIVFISIKLNPQNPKIINAPHIYNANVLSNSLPLELLGLNFIDASIDLYSDDIHYYITLKESDKSINNPVDKDFEIEQLKKEVSSLKDVINRLEQSKEELEKRVDRYRCDYLYCHSEWSKLADKEYHSTIDDINQLKLDIKKNSRGAGRKQKFNDADIESIKMYRLQGKTMQEIAAIYNCSIGLIHKVLKNNP